MKKDKKTKSVIEDVSVKGYTGDELPEEIKKVMRKDKYGKTLIEHFSQNSVMTERDLARMYHLNRCGDKDRGGLSEKQVVMLMCFAYTSEGTVVEKKRKAKKAS